MQEDNNESLPKYIRGHINLFGAWVPGVLPSDVINRKPGTEILQDLIEGVLARKLDTLEEPVIERFAEISPQELYIPIVPDEPKLLDRLLKPLKSAKRLYCFEEYLAALALCGLVGESLAMLVYRLQKPKLGDSRISLEQEKQLFGSKFDKLGQERRVQVLKCFTLINNNQEELFSKIRAIRRKYLHLWEVDTTHIQADAKDCFLNAMRLFKEISGLAIGEDGTLIMSPYLLEYIKEQEKANG